MDKILEHLHERVKGLEVGLEFEQRHLDSLRKQLEKSQQEIKEYELHIEQTKSTIAKLENAEVVKI